MGHHSRQSPLLENHTSDTLTLVIFMKSIRLHLSDQKEKSVDYNSVMYETVIRKVESLPLTLGRHSKRAGHLVVVIKGVVHPCRNYQRMTYNYFLNLFQVHYHHLCDQIPAELILDAIYTVSKQKK